MSIRLGASGWPCVQLCWPLPFPAKTTQVRGLALRESRTHGGNYRFLSIRCDCNWDHFHRLPLSVGVPAGVEPHSRAYLSAKGIRDIASGLFIAILMAYRSAHVLGWFMLAAALIPVADAVIVLHQGGSRTVAFGVHGGTAVAMLIIGGLLLIY